MVVGPDFYYERAVLITGATGFIGRRLVAVLRARGAHLRVMARSSSVLPADWQGIEIVFGDLADPASLARACSGANTVFHVAGFAHADADGVADFSARHWAVNFEGSVRLFVAAAAARVERLVFLSTVKAVADPGSHCVDECWDMPPQTPYGRAKRAAEERLTALGHEHGFHTVNLRPALVYGPGMKANLARLIAAARRGWLPPLPETGNRRSLVHVDDVVQAMLLGAAHPVAAGKTYFVTDGRPYSGRELSLILRETLGRPLISYTVPAKAIYGIAALADGLLRLAGRADRKVHAMVDKLLGWACYDSSRIEVELGYRPAWTLVRYCKESGLQG